VLCIGFVLLYTCRSSVDSSLSRGDHSVLSSCVEHPTDTAVLLTSNSNDDLANGNRSSIAVSTAEVEVVMCPHPDTMDCAEGESHTRYLKTTANATGMPSLL